MTKKLKLPPKGEQRTILVSYLITATEAETLDGAKDRFEKRNLYCRRAALEKANEGNKEETR